MKRWDQGWLLFLCFFHAPWCYEAKGQFLPLRLNLTFPCATKSASPNQESLYDCYLSASVSTLFPQQPWQRTTRHALQFLQPPKRVVLNQHRASTPAVALGPMRARVAIEKVFSAVKRWHLTTQERLFGQLRSFWPDDAPRVMVDLGCHAGHGPDYNTSDALIFLDFWNAAGTTVMGVDAFEDFAQDLQHRLAQHGQTPHLWQSERCLLGARLAAPGGSALSGVAGAGGVFSHRKSGHCLGCSSWLPPNSPIPPPLTVQARRRAAIQRATDAQAHLCTRPLGHRRHVH